jgi:hypothetical protein
MFQAEVFTRTAFRTGRTVYQKEFKRLHTAYIWVRMMAWYADHFVIPKHYGWQEVWGGKPYYDSTPVPIGIYWCVRKIDAGE